MQDAQLVGGNRLLRLNRLAVELIGGMALSKQLVQGIALAEQLLTYAGVAGEAFKPLVIGGQAQAGQNLAAFATMLIEKND